MTVYFENRGFKKVGPFVVMIYRMILGDLLRFVTIYLVFVLGFSQGLSTRCHDLQNNFKVFQLFCSLLHRFSIVQAWRQWQTESDGDADGSQLGHVSHIAGKL